MKTESQIQKVVDEGSGRITAGTKYPGMSYEEGVRAALEWVINDDSEESPLD